MFNKIAENILIIVPVCPVLNAGGSRHGLNFGLFLKRKGYTVTLAVPGRRISTETEPALTIKYLPYFNNNLLIKFLSFSFLLIPAYLRLVIKNRSIFIYGGNIVGFEVILIAGKILKRKIIFRSTLLGVDDIVSLLKNKILGGFRKQLFAGIFIYLSINQEFTNRWRIIYPDAKNILQSAQGVDTNCFQPLSSENKKKLRKKYGIPVDLPVILSVGYVIQRKGYDEIFRVLSSIEYPFFYIIIGDYRVSRKHYMHSYSSEMNKLFLLGNKLLKNRIRFLGSKNNINEYLSLSDIFLINSYQEGLPNVLLEAMSTGLCCIVRNLTGLDNFVLFHKKNVLTFNNSKSLKELLAETLRNRFPCRDIEAEARKWIIKNASFATIYEKITNFPPINND